MTLLSRLDALDDARSKVDLPWRVNGLPLIDCGDSWAFRGLWHTPLPDASDKDKCELVGAAEDEGIYVVSAVNLAPSLSAIARAAVARPWWRGGFEDDAGFDIWRCDGCDAPKDAPGDYAPHREPCRYSALDAAIDAAEGNA